MKAAWRFRAVAYTFIVMMAGTNIATPLYSGYEKKFGFGPLTVTLIFAAYVAALVPSLLLLGPLSDGFGTRRVVLPAIVVAVIASLVAAYAGSVVWLIVSRVLQGIAIGAASGALTAGLAENEPNGDRAKASMVGALAPNAGTGLGPFMAGILAEYAPEPRSFPYLAEVALLLIAAFVAFRVPDAQRDRAQGAVLRLAIPKSVRAVFIGSAMTAMIAFAVVGLFLALVPSLAHSTNLAVIGSIVGLLFATCVIAQWSGYRLTALVRQTAGLPLLAIGLGLLIVASAIGSLPWLLTATAFAGVGLGFAFSGAVAQLVDVVPPDRRAAVISSFYVAVYLGLGAPVIGVALLVTAIGLTSAVQWFSVVAGALCVLRLLQLVWRSGWHLTPPSGAANVDPDVRLCEAGGVGEGTNVAERA